LERRVIPRKDLPKKMGIHPLPPRKYLQVQYTQDNVLALKEEPYD